MVPVHLVALLIGAAVAPEPGPTGLGGDAFAHAPTVMEEEAGPGPRGGSGGWLGLPGWADSAGVAVLVHEGASARDLEPAQIRRVFLLRQRFWSDGIPAAPVNLPASSPLRESFSRLVLGQSTRDLADYWKDLYFHGTQPPPVLDSEEAVLLYVARTTGGVGYVSVSFLGTVTLPANVRVAGVWEAGG